jgi:hypothetical protein
VHDHDRQVIAAEDQRLANAARDLKARIDAQDALIAADERKIADEKNRADAADAAALKLRGPGAATCRSGPGAPATPVRRVEAPPAAPAAGPALPSADWASVPWDWLVQVVEEHDELLNDVQAAKDQHDKLEKTWPKDQRP